MTDLNALIEKRDTSTADLKIARENYAMAECDLARARAVLSRAEVESSDAWRAWLSARTRTARGKSGAEDHSIQKAGIDAEQSVTKPSPATGGDA